MSQSVSPATPDGIRIVSLLPSATEIVCALGLEDELVAITHECDFPPGVRGKPVVTSSVLSSHSSSLEIDRHIRQLVHEGSSIYILDAHRLEEQQPSLILTQELCAVCAVSYPIVERAARRLAGTTQIVSLEPERLEDVFEHIQLVGRLTGRENQARLVIAELRDRIRRVQHRVGERKPKRVVCLEWIDPLYNGGHWNPELVDMAGGQDLLGNPGGVSRTIPWEDVLNANPEVIVVMPCGFSLERTVEEMPLFAARAGWAELAAVRAGQVYAVDGSAFFSRPGPRLVDSVEIMAGILHPDVMPAPPREAARRWSAPPGG